MRYIIAAGMMIGLVAGVRAADPLPKILAPHFAPPAELANEYGTYKSLLKFADGTEVKSADDWKRRREEIRKTWHDLMGPWPKPIEKPKVEVLKSEKVDNYTRNHIRLEVAPGKSTEDAYLLVPEGKGPFPGVVVVFYDAATGVGLGKKTMRDFALRLAKKGFVALSLGSPPETYYPNKESCKLQPLSYHAYVASNCRRALANREDVDPKRIGIVGHSYGGKWSMFAAALDDEFACCVTSDPGIVFDEKRSNVNYWEPWYVGFDPMATRKRGIPTEANGRTGPYKKMMEKGHDLHELHALMAPRPFLVSGGSEDLVERWKPLNRSIEVNKLLGYENRVGLTLRKGHDPTEEAMEQIDAFFVHFLKAK
jgi:pimeloyl-ACP methyl ester carboxylesterase